MVVSFQ